MAVQKAFPSALVRNICAVSPLWRMHSRGAVCKPYLRRRKALIKRDRRELLANRDETRGRRAKAARQGHGAQHDVEVGPRARKVGPSLGSLRQQPSSTCPPCSRAAAECLAASRAASRDSACTAAPAASPRHGDTGPCCERGHVDRRRRCSAAAGAVSAHHSERGPCDALLRVSKGRLLQLCAVHKSGHINHNGEGVRGYSRR